MANTIKKGESLFIPFKNGESIYDSQLKPRMYKTKEQYDRFSYRFDDAEMVEYAEVVRCKDCKHRGEEFECPMYFVKEIEWDDDGYTEYDYVPYDHTLDDGFCDRGERREGE